MKVDYKTFCTLPKGTIYSAVSASGACSGLAQIAFTGHGGGSPEGWLLDPGWVVEHCDPVIGPKHFAGPADRIYVLESDDLERLKVAVDIALGNAASPASGGLYRAR